MAGVLAGRPCGTRVSYLDELGRELGAVGIRGRLRGRILAEADDHLRSDPEALGRFGSAREIANGFAAELGTQAARRASFGAFAALAVAGAVYASAYIAVTATSHPSADGALASLALLAIVVGPQVRSSPAPWRCSARCGTGARSSCRAPSSRRSTAAPPSRSPRASRRWAASSSTRSPSAPRSRAGASPSY